ncbi:MAG: transketolase [Oscillospiraceae bacterium]|nr:transketolase [Oscillospiraceae bacterium]
MKKLRLFAEEIRVATLEELGALGFGHVGGAMSIVELAAVLYGSELRHDPKNPRWEERDWLVMSKGHAGPALYATLALSGYFPMEELKTLNQGGTNLPSHCDRNHTLGVDMTTGSLGQGISAAIGIALGNRLDGRENYTYFVLGDGECNEGQVWEGAMFAPSQKLDHLIGFVDLNGQQLDGYTKDILDLGDMGKKWVEFGWNVINVNGHDIEELFDAIRAAKAHNGTPTMIVLHTKKGHGCTFAEDNENNHHMNFKPEQMEEALAAARKILADAKAAL